MTDLLFWPSWILVLAACIATGLILLPVWLWSKSRRRAQALRREVIVWRSEKLLRSQSPLDLEISGIKRKSLLLRFADQEISFVGRRIKWSIPFGKVKRWKIFDQNSPNPDFVNTGPQIWNLELQDSTNLYTLDASFINDSEALDLIKAACVKAFGSNDDTALEGLLLELAKHERLLHEINSGNANMKKKDSNQSSSVSPTV